MKYFSLSAAIQKAAVIPLLDLGQRQNKGWRYQRHELRCEFGDASLAVIEVATFYTMFNRVYAIIMPK